MKKISIIGFGRFGKTLYQLLRKDFEITIYSRHAIDKKSGNLSPGTMVTDTLADAYTSETIFYAVPISAFEEVIKSHKQYFKNTHVLIDVLSVKLYPMHVFNTYLKNTKTQALLTHPMFGPDSTLSGFDRLPMVIDKFKASDTTFTFWFDYFRDKKLNVIEMNAEDHDKMAGNSQGLTHFIGRLLEEYGLKPTAIDSLGTQKLLEIKEQTCNDSFQLFTDLQHFNPHTKHMRLKLGEVYDRLYNKLLPKQVGPEAITFGIQGGRGSFNEEALDFFVHQEGLTKYNIKYLYTSENVLHALHIGEIDRGQFATHNSVGGIVDESIQAMARYKFEITNQFAIKISHALMIRKDADFSEVTTIMSHPQVFAQCKDTLSKKYPNLKQISGEGELIDHAAAAKHLHEKKLPKHMAIMGSKILSRLYDLQVIEDNLQDAKENYTSFLQVSRI